MGYNDLMPYHETRLEENDAIPQNDTEGGARETRWKKKAEGSGARAKKKRLKMLAPTNSSVNHKKRAEGTFPRLPGGGFEKTKKTWFDARSEGAEGLILSKKGPVT